MLSEKQKKFILRRKMLVRIWPVAFITLIGLYAALVGFILIRSPILINPFLLMDNVRAGTIKTCSLYALGACFPVALLLVLFIMLCLIVFMHGTICNEKRFLSIIENQEKERV